MNPTKEVGGGAGSGWLELGKSTGEGVVYWLRDRQGSLRSDFRAGTVQDVVNTPQKEASGHACPPHTHLHADVTRWPAKGEGAGETVGLPVTKQGALRLWVGGPGSCSVAPKLSSCAGKGCLLGAKPARSGPLEGLSQSACQGARQDRAPELGAEGRTGTARAEPRR